MKNIISDLYNGIIGSFDNKDSGFSARKVSAFVVICLVVSLHIKWFKSEQWQYIAEILFLDFTFILVCLGLATWQNIKTKQIEKGL
jgi:hypothetical protein